MLINCRKRMKSRPYFRSTKEWSNTTSIVIYPIASVKISTLSKEINWWNGCIISKRNDFAEVNHFRDVSNMHKDVGLIISTG